MYRPTFIAKKTVINKYCSRVTLTYFNKNNFCLLNYCINSNLLYDGVTWIISESLLSVNKVVCKCFIDRQKAFIRVNCEKLIVILMDIGVNWRDRGLMRSEDGSERSRNEEQSCRKRSEAMMVPITDPVF